MSLLVIHLLAIRAREISAITAEAGDLVIWHSHGERSVIPGWAIWHADTCKKWQEMLAVDGIDEAAYALAGPREIDLYPMKWRGIVSPLAGSLCRIETVDGHVHEFSARNSNLRTTVLTLEIVQAETQRHLERKAEEARQEQLRTVPEVRRLVLINGANLTHGVNAQARISGEASNARRVDSEDNVALWEGERGEEREALCTITPWAITVLAWQGEVIPAPAAAEVAVEPPPAEPAWEADDDGEPGDEQDDEKPF